jgi:leucyl-tRNA synthetase
VFLKPGELDLSEPDRPKVKASGELARITFEKMSKSKYNGVDPAECMKKYGADATRAHILSLAPETETLEWREGPIVGIIRSSLREHGARARLLSQNDDTASSASQRDFTAEEAALLAQTRSTIESITAKLHAVKRLNTVISDLLKLSNALDAAHRCATAGPPSVSAHVFGLCASALVRLMAPIVPAWAEESWAALNGATDPARSVFEAPWPAAAEIPVPAAAAAEMTTVLQLNGRKRCDVLVEAPPEELLRPGQEKALEEHLLRQMFEVSPAGKKLWESKEVLDRGKNVERVVVVRGGRVVNLVTKKVRG